MKDYSFEACTNEHPQPQDEDLRKLYDDAPEAWERLVHDQVCLSFDRQYEFQLRVPLKGASQPR